MAEALMGRSLAGRTTFAVGVTLGFIVLGAVGIAYHEMWRDELQAWMIARDSDSLAELFRNMRYEGHPALWHLGLYAITRVTSDPVAMQVLHLGIAAATVFLFTRFAPFPAHLRLMFAFGYFPFYEYAIISRNYGLGLLLIVIFCTLFGTRLRTYLPLAVTLALLANTNPYAWIIAGALGSTLIYDAVSTPEVRRSLAGRRPDLVRSAMVFMGGMMIALVQILPAPGSGFATEWRLTPDLKLLEHTLTTLAHGYLPLPNLGGYDAWNSSILWQHGFRLPALLALVLIGISLALLARHRVALVLYLSGTLAILLFTYVKYFGSLRHHGSYFLVLIASLWIAREQCRDERVAPLLRPVIRWIDRQRLPLLTLFFGVHLAAGAALFALDLAYPFSAAKQTAGFIRREGLDGMPIVGSRGYQTSPVSGYLRRSLYYPESERSGTFMVWDTARAWEIPQRDLCRQLGDRVAEEERAVLLLVTHEQHDCGPSLRMTRLASFDRSIVPDERYTVYQVVRALELP